MRGHPSCVELWFAGAVADIVRAYDEAQAKQFLRVLVERGLRPVGTPPLVMQVAWETGRRLFEVAFRRTPRGDAATIGELRRLVATYLETYATPTPRPRA
ncbi:hypothetical protein AB0950_06245 [Streptomyces sp. NPDC007189]